MSKWTLQARKHLREKTLGYWVQAVIVGLLGLYINVQLSHVFDPDIVKIRMFFYKKLIWTPRAPLPANAAAVLISDADFWLGPLDHRSPIKRDYLGGLVTHLCDSGAKTVALDFIFSSPSPVRTPADTAAYQGESKALVSAVQGAAAKGCRVVMPVLLNCADRSQACIQEGGIFDEINFRSALVTYGVINAPDDTRRMATQVPLRNGKAIDSFAEAIVRAQDPKRLPAEGGDEHDFPFVTFLDDTQFLEEQSALQSDWVRTASVDALREKVAGKAVLVGAGWHSKAFGDGEYVDQHQSPVGKMTGVILHLNYVAAALDNRLVPAISEKVALAIDVLFVVLLALGFAALGTFMQRWVFAAGLMVLLGIIQLLAWQTFGRFIDCALPVLLLAAHCLWDENSHMRRELGTLRRFKAEVDAAVMQKAADELASQSLAKQNGLGKPG